MALEVMNRYECSFINTAAEGVKLAELVDSPALGLLLDTFHMNIEEKSMGQAIRLAGDRLYGGARRRHPAGLQRHFLHAALLGFSHPSTKETLLFESELPAELEDVLAILRGKSSC